MTPVLLLGRRPFGMAQRTEWLGSDDDSELAVGTSVEAADEAFAAGAVDHVTGAGLWTRDPRQSGGFSR